MAKYSLPLDIANRALQHLKKPHIASLNDFAPGAFELNFSYDKLRLYELQRNLWVFATKTAILRPISFSTMYIQPAAWNASTAYTVGSIVAFPAGTYWYAKVPSTGQAPGNANQDANGHLYWDAYFGPLTAEQYKPAIGNAAQIFANSSPTFLAPTLSNSSGYQPGEMVYILSGAGTAVVYQCLRATGEAPTFVDTWDEEHHYQAGNLVQALTTGAFELGESLLSGTDVLTTQYMSLTNMNFNNDPALTNREAPQPTWNAVTAWVQSDYVLGSDNQVYLCVQNSQGDGSVTPGAAGYNPVLDYGQNFWQPLNMWANSWTTNVPANVNPNRDWQQVNVALVPITIAWPLGTGPAEDRATLNIYRLPAGWLRIAPDEPKTGITPWLGGPTFIPERDWVFQDQFVVSSQIRPMKIRFVADFQDVSLMDTMFCEALAIVMAEENADAVDADEKVIARLPGKYRNTTSEARAVNAIEVGPVTPPDCQLISVRY